MSNGFGKCVNILHTVDDFLCTMYAELPKRPRLGPPLPSTSKFKELESQCSLTESVRNTFTESLENDSKGVTIGSTSEYETIQNVDKILIDELNPVQIMDSLLEYCFLKACKTSLKKNDLPIITSTFFKNHIILACPPGKSIDIKKSSFKKLSVFLDYYKKKGFIDTSIVKGVETLLSVKVSV